MHPDSLEGFDNIALLTQATPACTTSFRVEHREKKIIPDNLAKYTSVPFQYFPWKGRSLAMTI